MDSVPTRQTGSTEKRLLIFYTARDPNWDPPVEPIKENTGETANPTAQPLSVKNDEWVVVTLKNRRTDER